MVSSLQTKKPLFLVFELYPGALCKGYAIEGIRGSEIQPVKGRTMETEVVTI
jgi:hypothetical protein